MKCEGVNRHWQSVINRPKPAFFWYVRFACGRSSRTIIDCRSTMPRKNKQRKDGGQQRPAAAKPDESTGPTAQQGGAAPAAQATATPSAASQGTAASTAAPAPAPATSKASLASDAAEATDASASTSGAAPAADAAGVSGENEWDVEADKEGVADSAPTDARGTCRAGRAGVCWLNLCPAQLPRQPARWPLGRRGVIRSRRVSPRMGPALCYFPTERCAAAHTVAPALAAASKQLERSITKDKVAHALKSRPDREALAQEGILSGARVPSDMGRAALCIDIFFLLLLVPLRCSADSPMSPALHSPARQLERKLKEREVARGLHTRSSPDSLAQRGIIATGALWFYGGCLGPPADMRSAACTRRCRAQSAGRGACAGASHSQEQRGERAGAPPRCGGAGEPGSTGLCVRALLLLCWLSAHPVLRAASRMAPSLQGVAKSLEHTLRRDSVRQLLETRPSAAELQAAGILRACSCWAAPAPHARSRADLQTPRWRPLCSLSSASFSSS